MVVRARGQVVLGLMPTHWLLRLVLGLVPATDGWGQVLGSPAAGLVGSWNWCFGPLVGRARVQGFLGLLPTD